MSDAQREEPQHESAIRHAIVAIEQAIQLAAMARCWGVLVRLTQARGELVSLLRPPPTPMPTGSTGAHRP